MGVSKFGINVSNYTDRDYNEIVKTVRVDKNYIICKNKDMSLENKEKQKLLKKYGLHKEDTGSPEVQIALFTRRIQELSEHLKEHRKDEHSRRGLVKLVGKRRRMINHLKSVSKERFDKLVKSLDL